MVEMKHTHCQFRLYIFSQCAELLTQSTVSSYLLPIVETVPRYLESMSEEELKKETKGESNKNDALATIVKSLKSIAASAPGQEEAIRQLEMFRLKMILRQLQVRKEVHSENTPIAAGKHLFLLIRDFHLSKQISTQFIQLVLY